MKIAISAETTADLSKELYAKYDIRTIPFKVLLGEKVYKDGDIDTREIFDFVNRTGVLPKTTALNEFEYKEYFKELLKEYDAVIHFSLSSKISSSCEHAIKASNHFDGKVVVIDSKSLSTGIALEAIYARELAEQGTEFDEIVEKVIARIPNVQASFVVNTLSYLHKGGRCSSLARFGGAILRLKPQIIVNNGAMQPGKKFIGRSNSCVNDYCELTLKQFDNPDKSIVFITHSRATEEMVAIAREKLEALGFERIYETIAGATITSHCGPKTLGILYINDGGIEK